MLRQGSSAAEIMCYCCFPGCKLYKCRKSDKLLSVFIPVWSATDKMTCSENLWRNWAVLHVSKMCVDGLELIYTFNIMSCNVFQAGKWLNANISCYLMGHQICCFTMKYDPLHLQIFTTHCILSLISVRKQWNENLFGSLHLSQPGTQQGNIGASHL